MMNFKVFYLLSTFTVVLVRASPINEEKVPEVAKDVPKGKSLVFAEPLYNDHDLEIIPEYQEPVGNYYDADPLGDFENRKVIVYPTSSSVDMQGAESNIVFRPLFAYRKQLEQRRRVYLQPKVDKPPQTPKRRGYYYYYGYPLYYHNRQFDHVS